MNVGGMVQRFTLSMIPHTRISLALNKGHLFLRNVSSSLGSSLTVGPFRRMKYEEAIDWLASHDPPVLNKEGEPHVFGMDIEEGTYFSPSTV
jgi:hypothetical protein